MAKSKKMDRKLMAWAQDHEVALMARNFGLSVKELEELHEASTEEELPNEHSREQVEEWLKEKGYTKNTKRK